MNPSKQAHNPFASKMRGVDTIPYKPWPSTSSSHSHSFSPRTHGFRSTTIPAVINNNKGGAHVRNRWGMRAGFSRCHLPLFKTWRDSHPAYGHTVSSRLTRKSTFTKVVLAPPRAFHLNYCPQPSESSPCTPSSSSDSEPESDSPFSTSHSSKRDDALLSL
jgi:hypothetical protein